MNTQWGPGANGAASWDAQTSVRGRGRQTLICFSHLRWDFVFQRPQHLMTRFAQDGRRVIFWEEPVTGIDPVPALDVRPCPQSGVLVATPVLPDGLSGAEREAAQRRLLDNLLAAHPGDLIRWYYTPMMLGFSGHLDAACTVYDCMDELANFKFAPPELAGRERDLFAAADVVFTGGHSLYEAKRDRHPNIHPFPSSVDRAHFARARDGQAEPLDLAGLRRPRFGFYGVVDERMDLDLLAAIADARPEWSLAIVGPVVKIDPADLPRHPNIHYLGARTYDELPAYLSGWDVAIMPFARNESTRFISPTKTPEYLAGGCPVVSTPITDVVRSYGDSGLVWIADDAPAFIAACEAALAAAVDTESLLAQADRILGDMSWDQTWMQMQEKIRCAL